MNKDNTQRLIDKLKSIPDEAFDMDVWVRGSGCSTVACIGGWAMLLATGDENGGRTSAREFLGLDFLESEFLFYTLYYKGKPVTKTFAIKLLEDLIETNKVYHDATYTKHQKEIEASWPIS